MIEITNMKQAVTELQKTELSQNTIKDILLQAYIIDTQYPKEIQNKIVLLQDNEQYDTKNLIPEIEEDIDDYHKSIYILSDYGEGLIIYKRYNTDMHNDTDTTQYTADTIQYDTNTYNDTDTIQCDTDTEEIDRERLQILLYNAITYIEDSMLCGKTLIDTEIADELNISCDEYECLMSADNENNEIAERRKIQTK